MCRGEWGERGAERTFALVEKEGFGPIPTKIPSLLKPSQLSHRGQLVGIRQAADRGVRVGSR